MREIIDDVRKWLAAGQSVALATVVQTWGSAPRGVGAKMAITGDGKLAGSISGGCIEGAVAQTASEVLNGAQPSLLTFGVADETAWKVGLACGGTIQVFVERLVDEDFSVVDQMLSEEQSGAVVTVIGGPEEWLARRLIANLEGRPLGTIHDSVDKDVLVATESAMRQGSSRRLSLPDKQLDLFIDVINPPHTLIIVGGVHIAVALSTIAKTLSYRTVVIDPRRAFGNQDRFPHVDRLIPQWPKEAFSDIVLNERTAVALLTHDPKIDDPALELVLPSPAFYVGALGSRKTHAQRIERLQAHGFSAEQIAQIHGPIGLEINAQSPEEIALSIMAEIVAMSH